jgi:Ca2+-binding EF-hand superfamily protein
MMMTEVKKLREQAAAKDAADRKAMFELKDDGSKTELGDPPPAYKSRRQPGQSELDEWDKYNLRLLFQQYDKDNNGWLSQDELRACLHEMEDHGRTVEIEISDGKDNLDRLFDALDSNNDNKITWKEFLVASTEGYRFPESGPEEPLEPPLTWGKIDWEHAKDRSLELYEEAKDIQMKALTLEKDDPRVQGMQEEAKRLSNKANRLDAIYAELTAQIKAPPKQPPKPRSDLVTICDYKQKSSTAPEESDSSDEDEEPEDEEKARRRAKFGLSKSEDYKTFRKDKRAARPQKSVKNRLNL